MGGCESCREAVTELSGMPTVLALLDREEVAAIDEGDHVSGVPPLRPELLTPSCRDVPSPGDTMTVARRTPSLADVGLPKIAYAHAQSPPNRRPVAGTRAHC
jgi:hypothetical protein